jgi:hypothetical protein
MDASEEKRSLQIEASRLLSEMAELKAQNVKMKLGLKIDRLLEEGYCWQAIAELLEIAEKRIDVAIESLDKLRDQPPGESMAPLSTDAAGKR